MEYEYIDKREPSFVVGITRVFLMIAVLGFWAWVISLFIHHRG